MVDKPIENNILESNSGTETLKKRPFLFGFANSMFQSSGNQCGKSNWSVAISNGTVPSSTVGQFISHWDNFEADLNQMEKMGVNSYRFSIEWSDVEPEPGVYDETILERYAEMIAACHARHIEPMITLYHFIEPYWFTKIDGFENVDNIPHYTNYCELLFKRFGKQVKYWCTLNEPGIQAFSAYCYGQFPPHQHNLKKALSLLQNLLIAHLTVYKKLKQLPGGDQAQIGIVHNVLRFIPRYKWEPIECWVTKLCTEICDDLIINFLKTGRIDYDHWFYKTQYYNPAGPTSYDFIGLNFYGNVVIGFNSDNFFGSTKFPGQDMGDFHIAIDPVGFSNAIDSVAALGKPVFITETGLADEHDKSRGKFLHKYFAVIKEKLKDKVDLHGCYIWTFSDNYEWHAGFAIKFGLVDHFRIERDSAQEFRHFASFVKELNSR